MTRVCPVCKKNLGGYDYYFCSSCGSELPVETCNINHVYRKTVDLRSDVKNSQEFIHHLKIALGNAFNILQPKFLFSLLGAVFTVLVVFVLYKTQFSKIAMLNKLPQSAKPNVTLESTTSGIPVKHFVNLDIPYKTGVFGNDSVSRYVPYSVDVYIEGNDLEQTLDLYSQYDSAYIPLYKNTMGLLKDHYAIFGKNIDGKMEWGYVLYPRSPEGVRVSELIKDYPWLKHKDKENVYLISTSPTLLKLADEATIGEGKTLGMNPKYYPVSKLMTKQGKFFVMLFSKDGKLAADSLASNPTLTENISKVVKMFSVSGLEYAIIL